MDGWRGRIFRMWVFLCLQELSISQCMAWGATFCKFLNVEIPSILWCRLRWILGRFFHWKWFMLAFVSPRTCPLNDFSVFFLAFAFCNSRFAYVWTGFLLLLPLLPNSAAIHHYVCLGNCWQLATWMEGRWSIGGCARLSAWCRCSGSAARKVAWISDKVGI